MGFKIVVIPVQAMIGDLGLIERLRRHTTKTKIPNAREFYNRFPEGFVQAYQ